MEDVYPHRTLRRGTIDLGNKPVVYGVYASERLSLRDTGLLHSSMAVCPAPHKPAQSPVRVHIFHPS